MEQTYHLIAQLEPGFGDHNYIGRVNGQGATRASLTVVAPTACSGRPPVPMACTTPLRRPMVEIS